MTNEQIANLRAEELKKRRRIDKELYLHLNSRGEKEFTAEIPWRGGKFCKILGAFAPNFGVAEAKMAKKQLDLMLAGKNSARMFKTIEELFEAFIKSKENGITKRSILRYKNIYKTLLKPFADRSPDDIKRAELIMIIKNLRAQSMPRRAIGAVNLIYEFGAACGDEITSPLSGIRPSVILGQKNSKNYPTFTKPADIARLFKTIHRSKAQQTHKLALVLQALTALRTQNIRHLEWAQISGDALLCIPAEMMKTRRPFYLPLNAQAMKVLQRLKDLQTDKKLVVPARGGGVISDNTLRMLLRRGGITNEEFTPHGFRAMFSTIANEHNHPSEIIELCLAHTTQGVRGVYDRSHRIEAKRELMQWWGDYLEPFLEDFLL